MTINQIEKAIARAKASHAKRRAKELKGKYPYDIGEFKGLALPWRPRLQVFKGCNGKAVFDPSRMRGTSYGYWEVIRVIKGKVVFNDYRYSSTTSGHQSKLDWLMEQLGIKIHAVVEVHGGLQHFESQVLQPLYTKLIETELKISNPRTPKRCLSDYRKTLKGLKKQIKLCRSLGAKFPNETVKGMRANAIEKETRRLQVIKEAAAQRRMLAKQVQAEALPAENLFS